VRVTGAALLGFAAGVAVTVLVASLISDRGAEDRGAAATVTTGAASDESKPAFAGNAPTAARARPIEMTPVAAAPAVAAAAAPAADDRLGLLLYGLVTDANGTPVKAQAWMGLSLTPESGAASRAEISDSGAYSVPGLRPGRWTIVTDLLGYLPVHDVVELTPQVPALRHDLMLQPSTMLAVKAFTTDGRPILDALVADVGQGKTWGVGARVSALASVEALRGAPRYEQGYSSRFGVGSYTSKWDLIDRDPRKTPEIPDDAMGVLELDVPPPLWVSLVNGTAILASQRVEAGANEVVFRLDVTDVMSALATLDARFVDAETRAPLAGVRVEMDRELAGGQQPVKEDGRLHCDKIAPGTLRIDVVLKDYEHLSAKLDFSPGQHLDLGDVALNEGRRLSGQVLDEDGHPLRTLVGVRPLDQDSLRPFEEQGNSWKTEDDGRFDFRLVGRHRYSLAIADRDHASAPIVVDTHPADITGLVLRAGAGAPVSLHFEWGFGESHGLRITNTDTQLTSDWGDTTGQYVSTRRFLAGHYLVEVCDDTKVLLSRGFDVGMQPVDVTLKP